MNNNKQQGVTLIELMVTLSVVAILVSVAAPSLSTMIENNRLTALNNQLVSAINYTRGEAVKRNYNTAMCVRNSSGSGCATAGNFDGGWIVFVDCDADGVVDTANTCDLDGNGAADAPEAILQDSVPSTPNISITSNFTPAQRITYKPNGSATDNGTLALKVGADTKYEIKVTKNTGRVMFCKPTCP